MSWTFPQRLRSLTITPPTFSLPCSWRLFSIIDVVRIAQAGYPYRLHFADFLYKCVLSFALSLLCRNWPSSPSAWGLFAVDPPRAHNPFSLVSRVEMIFRIMDMFSKTYDRTSPPSRPPLAGTRHSHCRRSATCPTKRHAGRCALACAATAMACRWVSPWSSCALTRYAGAPSHGCSR